MQLRHKPNLETASYLGLLTQLLKTHMGMGGTNPFREDRKELLAAGVPLASTKIEREPNYSRPDVKWRNQQLVQWQRQHQAAAATEVRAQRQAIAAKWAAMPAAERATVVHQTPGGKEEEQPSPVGELPAGGSWRLGDETWPIRAQLSCGKRFCFG